jgi:hypothetical protein
MVSSSASTWISIKLIHHHLNTRLVTSSQHEAGTSQHEVGTSSQQLSWHIITTIKPTNHQHEVGITTLLPLSREVLSDYTELISKVLKLYTR